MAPTFGGSTSAQGASGTATATAPAGVAAGHFQLLLLACASASEPDSAAPAGWTLLGHTPSTAVNTYQVSAYYSTTATGSVAIAGLTRGFSIWRGYWTNHGGYRAASWSGTNQNTTATAATFPSKTPPLAESLVIAYAVQDRDDLNSAGSSTPPVGFTERYDFYSAGETLEELVLTVADLGTTTDNQVVSGSFTWDSAPASSLTGSLILDAGVTVIPLDPESGDFVDTLTVDQTDWKDHLEAGDGVDDATVFVDWDIVPESGDGQDTIVVDILVDVTVGDSGDGADTVTVTDFLTKDVVDSGDGIDDLSVNQVNLVDLIDAGDGTDFIGGLEEQLALTDSGDGQDSLVGIGTPSITDSADTVEEIYIVDIPFTQVLPPSRLGNLYDLVAMARVPQENGPPLLLDVDPIEWTELSFANELSVAQELSVGCQVSSLTPAIIQRLRDLATQPTELWLYRNGRLVFSGAIQGGTVSGERMTLTAKGLLAYLRHMFVSADLTYKNVDQHTIVKNLVDHWQNLDYGNFGIDTSTIIASGVTREVTYLKNELHNIAQRVEEMSKSANGFDVEVDPETRQLHLWFPFKGVDRSTGEDAVVFDTRNITSSSVMFSAGPTDIATMALGTGTASVGDGTTYATATNAELLSRFGRAGVAGTWDQVPNQATLNGHVQGLIDARGEQLVVPGPDARDTPDSGLGTYAVGDTILYQPNELLMVTSAFRIRKQSVKVAGSGQESVSLEFV